MTGKSYYSYVRVSTQRQGALGTSLSEQQAAIESYAKRFNLNVIQQYEERETAAKTGRPVFLEMLRGLKNRRADGLIIHKIDRSARNLRDWADLGSLIDLGLEVHFANESLDMASRGGRLSADIQAVVAADYIRNLREETKKGIYGRLRQGLYPFPARVGYLDTGRGKPKKPDPVQAPLIRHAFEAYASGDFGLNALAEKMFKLGLRNKNGKKISRNGLVCILKNPFYMGLVRLKTTGELFIGIHKSIVSKALFDEVQHVFAGKRIRKKNKHFFAYRRIVTCQYCKALLIAERQKGNVYYRCQTKSCPQKTIREEVIERKLLETYESLKLTESQYKLLVKEARHYQENEPKEIDTQLQQLKMEMAQTESRLARVADAYLDGVFSKEAYIEKKNELITRQKEITERIQSVGKQNTRLSGEVEEFLELLKTAYISYKLGNEREKREMVQITISNLSVEGKSLLIEPKKPFQMVLKMGIVPTGSPRLATTRTFRANTRKLFKEILQYFKDQASDSEA